MATMIALLVLILLIAVTAYAYIRRLIRKPTSDTWKRADQLTQVDLETFPVWQYPYEEDIRDESFVRPAPDKILLANRHYVVSSQFTTPAGMEYSGLIEIFTLNSSADVRHPTVSFRPWKWVGLSPPGGEVFCWEEDVQRVVSSYDHDFNRYRSRLEKALRLPFDQIFPIKWCCCINEQDGFLLEGTLGLPSPTGYEPRVMMKPK